jgi:hypothetical protein
MHKSATKCNETLGKWCKNKHGASKIMDTLETYHTPLPDTANTFEVEAHRKALKKAKKKELAERQKFYLEQQAAKGLLQYHQRRIQRRLQGGVTALTLDFNDKRDPSRAA